MKRHSVGDETSRILRSSAYPKEEDLLEAEAWRNRALNRNSSQQPGTSTQKLEPTSSEPPKTKKYRSSLPASYYSHNDSFRGYDDSPFDDGYARGTSAGLKDGELTRETEADLLQSVKRAKSQLRHASPSYPGVRQPQLSNGHTRQREPRLELDPIDDEPEQEPDNFVDGQLGIGFNVVLSPIRASSIDAPSPVFDQKQQLDALSTQIAILSKNVDVLRQSEDDERARQQHIIDQVSRLYAQKASEKVREIHNHYLRKLQEANNLIAQERQEKAELVRACDAYFSSVSDRRTY